MTVGLATSPSAAGFFEKNGFKRTSVLPGGFGPGLDRVELRMKLQVCA